MSCIWVDLVVDIVIEVVVIDVFEEFNQWNFRKEDWRPRYGVVHVFNLWFVCKFFFSDHLILAYLKERWFKEIYNLSWWLDNFNLLKIF